MKTGETPVRVNYDDEQGDMLEESTKYEMKNNSVLRTTDTSDIESIL